MNELLKEALEYAEGTKVFPPHFEARIRKHLEQNPIEWYYHVGEGIQVMLCRSDDGKLVLEIDTGDCTEMDEKEELTLLRIYLNEGGIYEAFEDGTEDRCPS